MTAHAIPAETIRAEDRKPIPVRIGTGRLDRIGFALRRQADLQLATIWRFLGPILPTLHGDVLDVGCGEMPFRAWLPADARYTGIDVPEAAAFGMTRHQDITPFDGLAIPFADARFDHVLCTEVLEHSPQPEALLAEIRRVLRPGGTLVLTVPFSARVHHAPYDFHRFTRFRLAAMLEGFADVTIAPRGNDVAAVANKLIVIAMRLARPSAGIVWRWPLLALAAPAAGVFLLIAHASMALGMGSQDDPLGYAVTARKPREG